MAETPAWEAYARSLWAIGKYQSPNGRIYAVFPDMNTWLAATQRDVQSKMQWWSRWVTPNTTLAQFASGWTVWPNAPLNTSAAASYAKLTWFPPSTPISKIPIENLVTAIVKHEWVNPSISNKIL